MKASFTHVSFLLIGTLCTTQWLAGQTIPKYDPPKVYTPTKMATYTETCGLWRTDASFRSAIRLKNNLAISPIDAVVTLFMADGTPYALPSSHLMRSGVMVVDVNNALANAPSEIKEHLSDFGSASVSYKYDWQGVVYASMSILDTTRSLQYSYPFLFPMTSMAQSHTPIKDAAESANEIQGMFWRYSKHSTAFLSFANTSSERVPVTMETLDSSGHLEHVEKFSVEAHNTLLRAVATPFEEFIEEESSEKEGRTGLAGLHITYPGDANNLSVVGGIEDDEHGYSANLPLSMAAPIADAAPVSSQHQFASAGLMNGKQDPMMGFPADVQFTPYAYVRNTTARSVDLQTNMSFGMGASAKQLVLPAMRLAPEQARRIPLKRILQNYGVQGSVTLSFSYSGTPGDVMAATGAVDKTGNYVFEVEPAAIGQSASKSVIYWTTASGFDTMYSIWNPTKDTQSLVLKFLYGDNKTYLLPLQLQPEETQMVDVAMVAAEAKADSHGNTLPLNILEGSLVVASESANDLDPMNVVISAGTYNAKLATCGAVCQTCNGCTGFQLNPNPFSGVIGTYGQLYSQCPMYDGSMYDYTNNSSFWSGNSGIITVQSNGSSNPGLADGVGAGQTTGYTQVLANPQTNAGQVCGGFSPPPCPTASEPQSNTPAAVKGVAALVIPNQTLTIEKTSGTSSIIGSVNLTGETRPAAVNVNISAPSNPSGIVLTQGSAGQTIPTQPTSSTSANFTFPIATSNGNPTSGKLTYSVTISTTDSNTTVQPTTPITVTVTTNP